MTEAEYNAQSATLRLAALKAEQAGIGEAIRYALNVEGDQPKFARLCARKDSLPGLILFEETAVDREQIEQEQAGIAADDDWLDTAQPAQDGARAAVELAKAELQNLLHALLVVESEIRMRSEQRANRLTRIFEAKERIQRRTAQLIPTPTAERPAGPLFAIEVR